MCKPYSWPSAALGMNSSGPWCFAECLWVVLHPNNMNANLQVCLELFLFQLCCASQGSKTMFCGTILALVAILQNAILETEGSCPSISFLCCHVKGQVWHIVEVAGVPKCHFICVTVDSCIFLLIPKITCHLIEFEVMFCIDERMHSTSSS